MRGAYDPNPSARPLDGPAFAAEWISAWNAGDLDRVLSHYAEDCRFSTPMAKAVVGATEVRGKSALRRYWQAGMQRVALRFTLNAVLVDQDAGRLAILYEAAIGDRTLRACEVFEFNSAGEVRASAAHYGAAIIQGDA